MPLMNLSLLFSVDGDNKIVKHSGAEKKSRQKILRLLEEYSKYKKTYVENIRFDPGLSNISKLLKISNSSKNALYLSCYD